METSQIILIVFIALLLIAYPIMMMTRNKKDRQRMTEQTNSLKRGDKVLTTSGIYGTIVDLHLENDTKIVTIETGTDKNKGYISVDAYSIYTIINPEEALATGNIAPAVETEKTEIKNEIDEVEKEPEVVSEPQKEMEKTATTKKGPAKKTVSKKKNS